MATDQQRPLTKLVQEFAEHLGKQRTGDMLAAKKNMGLVNFKGGFVLGT